MAYDGPHNRVLGAARRLLRATRTAATDRVLLAAARRSYGREMDDDMLRERIEYMFIPPEQLMTAHVRSELAPTLGLRLVWDREMRGTSATQLRQRATVFRKD
jgi:hypothetical protein